VVAPRPIHSLFTKQQGASLAHGGMLPGMPLPDVDRVILGGWQLAVGHGRDCDDGLAVLESHYAAGFRVLDCADIYSGVEALIGRFAAAHGLAPAQLRVHTKYVPDLSDLSSLGPADVRAAVERSCTRLGRDTLDLVQFHWWDYAVPRYLDALEALVTLQHEGRVRAIGLTNVDSSRLREIVAYGIPVAALQTQYSLLDRRPRGPVSDVAAEYGIELLAYGSVAGGLLSDRHLGAADIGSSDHENRSLTKYRLIVDELGGWEALQELLRALRDVANEVGLDVASVASAWVLQQPHVRACIVGIRSHRHVAALTRLRDSAPLAAEQLARLERARSRYPEVPGDVYDLERDRDGRHGRIMKYGLNRASA